MRCQAVATSMWMPSMRARMEAGASAASWKRAVERACPGRMPIWRRRSPSWYGLIGWPGRPPGSSHGEGPWSPVAAWPWRVAGRRGAVAGRGQAQQGAGGGLGEHDGFPAEPQVHFVVAGLDVAEGEAADGGGLLSVEQEEQPGDPGPGAEGGG